MKELRVERSSDLTKSSAVLGYEGVVLHKFFDRLFPEDRVYSAGLTRTFSKLAKEEGFETSIVQSSSKAGYLNNYVVIELDHLKKLIDSYNFKPQKVISLQEYTTMEDFTRKVEALIQFEQKLKDKATIEIHKEDGEPVPPEVERKIVQTALFLMILFGLLIFNACKVFGASEITVNQYLSNRATLYNYVVQHFQILQVNRASSSKISDIKRRAKYIKDLPSKHEALMLPEEEVKELNRKMILETGKEIQAIHRTVGSK